MTLIFLTFFFRYLCLYYRRQITNSLVPDVVDWSSCDYPCPYLRAGTLGTKTIPAEVGPLLCRQIELEQE